MNLSKKLNRLVSGDASAVFKGMATLALGSGGARLIGVAAIPILTRIYGPDDFGVLAVFSSLIMIIAPIVGLRYALALPLPKRDGTALHLLLLSLILIFSGCVLLTILLGIYKTTWLTALSIESLIPWWWLISVGVFAAATYETMSFWATRKRNYSIIAKTTIWQSISENTIKISMGALSISPLGLLLGEVMGKGGGLVTLIKEFRKEIDSMWTSLRVKRIKKIAFYYRGFPYYRVPSQFLLVLSIKSPLIFSAAVYGTDTTGQLSLALLALALPVNLIGGNVGRALYAEAAAIGRQNKERIYSMARDVQYKLLALSIPIGLIIFIAGDDIFVLAFGDQWEMAGNFASALSIYIVFQFTSAPLIQLMNILVNQSYFLILNIIRVSVLALLFLFSALLGFEGLEFAYYYSLTMSLFYLGISCFVMRSIKKYA